MNKHSSFLVAHLSQRLTKKAYRKEFEPASVRPSVHTFKHEYVRGMRPITIKFYLKHHWGGVKAALGFGAIQVRSLVMGRTALSRFLDCF